MTSMSLALALTAIVSIVGAIIYMRRTIRNTVADIYEQFGLTSQARRLRYYDRQHISRVTEVTCLGLLVGIMISAIWSLSLITLGEINFARRKEPMQSLFLCMLIGGFCATVTSSIIERCRRSKFKIVRPRDRCA